MGQQYDPSMIQYLHDHNLGINDVKLPIINAE